MSKAELRSHAESRRAFFNAVVPDLRKNYSVLPEPSRSTRLRVLEEEDLALRAFEERVGLKSDVAPVASPR